MNLSTGYSIDLQAPDVIRHNAEVREVFSAYQNDRPIRVPVKMVEWYGQHGPYADEIDLDYREYYHAPDLMVEVQLESARWRRQTPICDVVLGEKPESWPVSVDLWPVPPAGWVGCPVKFFPDCHPGHSPLRLSRDEADRMEMPDPVRGGLLRTCGEYFDRMRKRCQGLTFMGRPVSPVRHGVGTCGFFAMGLSIRSEDLMSDMYEDPDFVRHFLRKMAQWCQTLDTTWDRLSGGTGKPRPVALFDHGIDMLSPRLYEEFIVPVIHETGAQSGAGVGRALHHCGRGIHLFPIIHRHFKLESINALTWPYVDIARVRHELGPEVWLDVIVADHIVQQGPVESIREAVREVMKAKGKGRLSLMVGDLMRGAPLEHRLALYEAVREFGRY